MIVGMGCFFVGWWGVIHFFVTATTYTVSFYC